MYNATGPVLTPIFQKAIEQATPVRKSLSAQLRQECEQQLYTRYLFGHGAEKSMEGMLKHFAVSTRLTTAQLEHSVCSPFPAVRYRTGPLARGMQLVKWFLPDDVTDAVVSGLYGLMAALD
jgi:hypothetical protein